MTCTKHAQNQVMSLKHAQHAQKSDMHKSGFSGQFYQELIYLPVAWTSLIYRNVRP